MSTETGEDVPLGEAGELLVRGPQVTHFVVVFVFDFVFVFVFVIICFLV